MTLLPAGPNAVRLATTRVPAATSVDCVYVFAPDSVNVPLPVLVRTPEPLITPANSVDWSLPPVVRTVPGRLIEDPATPASEPIVSEDAISNVAPLAVRFTALSLGIAEPPWAASLPLETSVLPV